MPQSTLKFAILTPSYERAMLLNQCYRYARYQQLTRNIVIKWFVVDDSQQQHQASWLVETDFVDYLWLPTRTPLGAKRNLLNQRALNWGADYLFAMDDDDWYGDEYLAVLYALIQSSGLALAGSEQMYFYDIATGKIGKTHHIHGNTTCNGFMAYTRAHAMARCYANDAKSGEEPAFIRGCHVAQYSAPQNLHLMLIHPHNTVSKHNYLRDPRCQSNLTVDDLPLHDADKTFYRTLTAQYLARQPLI